MNLQTYSTKMTPSLQEVFSLWNEKILPLLPKQLETIAQQHQLLQRKRVLTSAFDMLRMFFLFASSGISLRMLSVAAASLGIATMSDTAWRKKLLASLSFLQQVLQMMLQMMLPKSLSKQQRRVLLVDGSLVRLQGKQQHQERVHLCYSLTENRMQQIKVTDYHTAETLSTFDFSPQDIVVADAGFGTVKNYVFALEQGTDVILRITPKRFPLFDSQGMRLDLFAMLKEAEKKKQPILEVFGFCKEGTRWHLVRVLAQRLPKEKAKQAQQRKRKKAQKNQSQIQEDTLFFANYLIVITSLGIEYSAEEVLFFYQSRWQIELVFKRWKQHLSITTIRIASEAYAEVMILLWLLIWMITERQAIQIERILQEKKEQTGQSTILSCWEQCRYAYFQIKEILCFSWSLFVDFNNPNLSRLLAGHSGKRKNQNQEFRTSILPGLVF